MNRQLPEAFIQQLSSHFSPDVVERVLGGLHSKPSVSIRKHPYKQHPKWDEEVPIPWHSQAALLSDRPNFALDPLFHAGAYYVQDSSSMILSYVLDQLDLGEAPLCLDMCAAPGGKSTQVLDALDGKGFLVANEVDPDRNAVLRENLLKWGYVNHAVTALEAQKLTQTDRGYDLILVDAPCSGEGMFRKDEFAIRQWSSELVDRCVSTQRSILDPLLGHLNEGGYLWYSTCTMNASENEEQILRLLQNEHVELAIPDMHEFASFLVPAEVDGMLIGYYLLPGISTGEGLFFSVLRNSGRERDSLSPSGRSKHALSIIPANVRETFNEIPDDAQSWEWKGDHHVVTNGYLMPEGLFYKRIGLPFYQIKGKAVIPLHGLAMASFPKASIALSEGDALRYLRKETLYLRVENPGWFTVTFEGIPLGWVKALENRTNNYYPNGLRLRI